MYGENLGVEDRICRGAGVSEVTSANDRTEGSPDIG